MGPRGIGRSCCLSARSRGNKSAGRSGEQTGHGPSEQPELAELARGTAVAAVLYSLMESAKLFGLDPNRYVRQAAEAAIDGQPIPLPHELAAK